MNYVSRTVHEKHDKSVILFVYSSKDCKHCHTLPFIVKKFGVATFYIICGDSCVKYINQFLQIHTRACISSKYSLRMANVCLPWCGYVFY